MCLHNEGGNKRVEIPEEETKEDDFNEFFCVILNTMGGKLSKKKGYDVSKSSKKKNKKGGKLNKRWKSVDVFTQTGDHKRSGTVKAAVSLDDLRNSGLAEDQKQTFGNDKKKDYSSSSDDSSDTGKDGKKKKKKRKLRKSKDKKNKNKHMNIEIQTENKATTEVPAEETRVIRVSDVSDIDRNSSLIEMVTNPLYVSGDAPSGHQIRISSTTSSNPERDVQQPSGDDLANEILEVVSSAQQDRDRGEAREIENLPDPPPPPPRPESETPEDRGEIRERIQIKKRRSSSSSSSSSSSAAGDDTRKSDVVRNEPDFVDIVYENAVLKSRRDDPVPVPYPDEIPEPVVPHHRRVSRSSSSSSPSPELPDVVFVPQPAEEPEEPFVSEEQPRDSQLQDVVEEIPTTVEDTEPQESLIDEAPHRMLTSDSPEVPEKPPRLRRHRSTTSSSSSSDEGVLIINAEPLPPAPTPPPPAKEPAPAPAEDQPAEIDQVVQVKEVQVITAAVVQEEVENIRIEAVLVSPGIPEPAQEPVVKRKKVKHTKKRHVSRSSSSSSSSSSSDSD